MPQDTSKGNTKASAGLKRTRAVEEEEKEEEEMAISQSFRTNPSSPSPVVGSPKPRTHRLANALTGHRGEPLKTVPFLNATRPLFPISKLETAITTYYLR